MFSVSRNERRRRIGARATADRESAAGIGDNSTEIGVGAAGIVDIAANVIPSLTPSWMETGVTLFLEDKFQRGLRLGQRRRRSRESHSMRRYRRSMRRRRRSRGVSGDIGGCGVGITPQMCNRVTNHGDMSTFSKLDASECGSYNYLASLFTAIFYLPTI